MDPQSVHINVPIRSSRLTNIQMVRNERFVADAANEAIARLERQKAQMEAHKRQASTARKKKAAQRKQQAKLEARAKQEHERQNSVTEIIPMAFTLSDVAREKSVKQQAILVAKAKQDQKIRDMHQRRQERTNTAIAEERERQTKLKERMARFNDKKAFGLPQKPKRITNNASVKRMTEEARASETKAKESMRRAQRMADLSDRSAERMRFINEMDHKPSPRKYAIPKRAIPAATRQAPVMPTRRASMTYASSATSGSSSSSSSGSSSSGSSSSSSDEGNDSDTVGALTAKKPPPVIIIHESAQPQSGEWEDWNVEFQEEGLQEESAHEDWLKEETQYTQRSRDSEWEEEETQYSEKSAVAGSDSSSSSSSSSQEEKSPKNGIKNVHRSLKNKENGFSIKIPSNRPNEPEINLEDLLKRLADEDMFAIFENSFQNFNHSFFDEL